MHYMESLLSLAMGVLQWESWQWRELQWLWLLVALPLFFYRSRRSRRSLFHPEPWFFASWSTTSICVRYFGLLLAGILLVVGIVALAHPVREKIVEEKSGKPGRVYAVIDTSGSINCQRYTALVQYFDTLMEESERRKLSVEFGVYFFSSTGLLQIFPGSPRERIVHTVVRYGPKCKEVETYFRHKYTKSVNSAMGSGGGTEPAPSILDTILDVLRAGSPELEPFIRHIQEEKGFADNGGGNTIPLPRYFPENQREEIIAKLREGARASRILFLTDGEFGVTDNTLAFSRVAELASLMELPIDLIVFSSGASGGSTYGAYGGGGGAQAQTVINTLKPTGGITASINSAAEISPSAPAVGKLLKRYRALPANIQVIPKTILDETPRQSLFALSLFVFAGWVILRMAQSIVDY